MLDVSNHVNPLIDKVKLTPEDDPSDFYYEPDSLFERPLIVRGTRKQVVPYPAIHKMQELTVSALDSVMETLRATEDFETVYLQSVSKLQPVAIKEEGFFLQVDVATVDIPETRNLFIPFDGSTVGFKRLSTLLGIPYAFSKKNPGHLNEINFSTWKDKICEEKHRELPICLILARKQIVSVEHEGSFYECNVVMTILSTPSAKKADGSNSLIKTDISFQVPILHKILPILVETVRGAIPDSALKLHSIGFGFDGSNRGDHYVKFLLDSPALRFEVEDDSYIPTLCIRSNFTGEDKKGIGRIFVSISLMKLLCQNGAMIPIPEEHLKEIRDNFVNKMLRVNSITADNPDFSKYVLKYSKQFKKKFTDFGCGLTLHEFLTSFQTSDFMSVLKIFLDCKDTVIPQTLQGLKTPFKSVPDEDFVDAVETLGNKHGVKPAVSKAVILEYLAGKQDGLTLFPDSYSVVNYMTYFAQSLDAKTQIEHEKKVIAFGSELVSALVHKTQYKKEALGRYLSMLRD